MQEVTEMENKDWNREYLVKCAGFGDPPWDRKLDEMLEQWKTTTPKLGLTEEDVKYAVTQWIPKNFEIGLEGVRKTIGALTVEVVDMMTATERKAKGEKMVYGILPAQSIFYRALKFTDPKVNTYFVDSHFMSFVQPFFHKIAPFLECAEEHGMRYGCRHCALNKTRYTLIRQGAMPLPDVSWIWGFSCDEGPKTDEFIKEYWNEEYPTVYSRMSHYAYAHEKEHENEEMVKYVGSILKDGYEKVCKALGIEVDESAIMKALEEWVVSANRYGELMELMAADPPPLSGEIVLFLFYPLCAAFNTGFEYFTDAVDALIKDAKNRVAKGEGIVPKGSPRGMMRFTPYCNPFIVRMFEENGVAVPYCEGLLPSKAELEMPKFKDPFEANAEGLLKWSEIKNWGAKCDSILEKMETYNIDFMIFGFEDFDRWLGSDHRIISACVEKRGKKPSFYIEGDIWEDRDYSEESLRTRIETMCEIIKARLSRSS
jgi:benzoyl-CoA reductase/2-hydroxyglutaryl-CoA dehydratase subunit BcrC/BadD/HgdB